MRLYRFIDADKKIDAIVVTDGSCDQKRVFITVTLTQAGV